MKKSSKLRKILMVLSILDTNIFLFSCTSANAVNYNIAHEQKVFKENITEEYDILNEYCLSCDSSLEASKDAENKKSDVVRCAYTLIGKPYVYGATGPNEFDCSGLTQYVYKSAGKNISRTTYTQVKEGVEVSRNNLMPGDLVFFNTNGYMSHVGIYVGNGSFIHAPRTGKTVTVSSLNEGYYWQRFATARRIFN